MTENKYNVCTLRVTIILKDDIRLSFKASSVTQTKSGWIIVTDDGVRTFTKSEVTDLEVTKNGKHLVSYIGGALVGLAAAHAVGPWVIAGMFAFGAKSKIATIGLSIAALIACVGLEWTICDIVSDHVENYVDIFIEAYNMWKRSRARRKAEKESSENDLDSDNSAEN